MSDAAKPRGLRLLAYITYYDRSPNNTQKSIFLGYAKTSRVWRDLVFDCLLRSLLEMEARYSALYDMLDSVDAVVDTNSDNAYLSRLHAFARAKALPARDARLSVRKSVAPEAGGARPASQRGARLSRVQRTRPILWPPVLQLDARLRRRGRSAV